MWKIDYNILTYIYKNYNIYLSVLNQKLTNVEIICECGNQMYIGKSFKVLTQKNCRNNNRVLTRKKCRKNNNIKLK